MRCTIGRRVVASINVNTSPRRLAHRLFSRPTGQLRAGSIEESDTPGDIGAHHTIADRGQRDLRPLLLEVQLCLGFLAPADIADGPDAR